MGVSGDLPTRRLGSEGLFLARVYHFLLLVQGAKNAPRATSKAKCSLFCALRTPAKRVRHVCHARFLVHLAIYAAPGGWVAKRCAEGTTLTAAFVMLA